MTTPLSQQDFDEAMMRRALQLARNGSGYVSPNPMVGAVIVDRDRTIIGEGWHERYGEAHAEINAMRAAAGADLSGSTLYVTLEPCNHFGKTPPCTDAVMRSGISRVVVAMRDPNPLVGGQGNKRLREAGIEVVLGVLEKEARLTNESYIHFISTGRPFVTVKLAQTLDGYLALPNGESRWITGEMARRHVHQLRADSDAVMVGTTTALLDDPALTVRHGIVGRNPRRIVLDARMELPPTLQMFTDDDRDRTIIVTSEKLGEGARTKECRAAGITVVGVPFRRGSELDIEQAIVQLGRLNITSLLIEGGATLAASVVNAELAQKIVLYTAPKLFGHGVKAFTGRPVENLDQAHRLSINRVEMLGEDTMTVAYWHTS